MTFFDYGVVVRIGAVFTNSAGTAMDPTTVKFNYKADAIGVTTTLTYGVDAALVKASTGNYYVDIDTTEWATSGSGGMVNYRFYATGTGQTSGQDRFLVHRAFA